MKNLVTALRDINADVKAYNNTVEKAQKKFWEKHPTYKKLATVFTVASVGVSAIAYLDEEGVFDSLKKRAKLVLLESLKNEADTEDTREEYDTLVSKIKRGEKLTSRDKAVIGERFSDR